jgi:D-tyrosyl-tRNA(Tyr) deacylase
MRAVIQRVSQARVLINQQEHSRIGPGILVLLGVEKNDTATDVRELAGKIANLRIFEDDAGKMNRALLEMEGQVLVVSQFTLLGDCRKGRRPSFDGAAPPDIAQALYESFVTHLRGLNLDVRTGVFQANMDVELTNHGPVTFVLDTQRQ